MSGNWAKQIPGWLSADDSEDISGLLAGSCWLTVTERYNIRKNNINIWI